MRATYLVWRLVASSLLLTGVGGCAETGLSEAELNGESDLKSDGGKSSSSTSKDAGKDARSSSSDDDDDGPTTPVNRDASTGGGSSKDASTGGGTTTKDAGTGGGGTAGAIKCPTPLVCETTLSTILSVLDPSVKSGASLCANTSSVFPQAVTCTTDDTCKSSRLTTAKCSSGSCIQPCTP